MSERILGTVKWFNGSKGYGFENVPVLAWLALRGRCRSCHARISVVYPLVELFTGVMFAWAAWRYGPGWLLVSRLVFGCMLVVLFFVDIMTTVLGVAGFSIYAIARGVKMIQWARAAEKEGARPAHLEGASPKRLKLAGVVLIVLTASIFGYSMLNVDEVTGAGEWRKRTYARMLDRDAKNAHAAVKAFLAANPKAGKVACEDMMKAGYTPSPNVACLSDMTAASGAIRVTGPERWKLKNPAATITSAGELTPAEP